jgi:L-asparaginase/Glu-tRNA(Gln) amidotransferase subunit D
MPIVFVLSTTGTIASRTERRMTLAVHWRGVLSGLGPQRPVVWPMSVPA